MSAMRNTSEDHPFNPWEFGQKCVVHNNTDLWLSAFTKEITKLLEAKSLTLNNTVEDIEEAMMNLQNITFKYDSQKNVITDIVSVKDHP